MKAIWQGRVVAESVDTVKVEGVDYFPPDSVKTELLQRSDTKTVCPWKGEASYFTITVGEESNRDAAWSYFEPKDAAAEIKGFFAFWRGVEMVSD
jgi:uncharacterized protein (DUF427 family)